MSKALIISVGTGVGGTPTIAQGIVFSVRGHNPDKVFYVVTPESENQTLPKVLAQCGDKPYEVWRLTDPEDINQAFDELRKRFKEVRDEFTEVCTDYTSGTKTMSAVLAILGSLYGVDTLSYVGGKRVSGTVASGSETLLTFSPYTVIAELKLAEAVALFNNCQYDACLGTTEWVTKRVAVALLPPEFTDLQKLAKAYSAWDKFQHGEARNILSDIKLPQLDGNKEFLGRLDKEPVKEPYYIADFLNNAMRRGDIEGKYDDAVARLYRVMELVAQWKLKVDHGIADTGDVPQEKVPFEYARSADGKIKLALYQCYQLLATQNDPVGRLFIEDKQFLSLLEARNQSILAHGTKPVSRDIYLQFKDKVAAFATAALKERRIYLERLRSISRFIKWG